MAEQDQKGFSWKDLADLPTWLRLLLTILPIPAYVKVLISLAWAIIQLLPKHEIREAIGDLRKAIFKTAAAAKDMAPDTIKGVKDELILPIQDWHRKWEKRCEGVACPSQPVTE